jgi:hypothetical protein
MKPDDLPTTAETRRPLWHRTSCLSLSKSEDPAKSRQVVRSPSKSEDPSRKRPPAPLPSVPEGTLLEPADARRLRQGPAEVRRPRRVPPSLKVRFEFRHVARRFCVGSRWCSEPRRHRSWHSPRPGPKSVSESSTSARCASEAEASILPNERSRWPESFFTFRGLIPAAIRYSHAGCLGQRAARSSPGLFALQGVPPLCVGATLIEPPLMNFHHRTRTACDAVLQGFRSEVGSSLSRPPTLLGFLAF